MLRTSTTTRQLVGATANMLVARRSMAKAASDLVSIELPESSFEGYNLEVPSLSFETEKENLLKMYKDMIVIRRMEMAADALYKAKKIRGFCHLSVGQEAIAVGIENAITPTDTVITSYRCHGFAHMRCFCQIYFGRIDG